MVVAETYWVTIGLVVNFKTIVIGALAGAVFFATNAMAAVYECNVRGGGPNGGVPPLVIFAINDDETEAIVYDGFIEKYHGGPIAATIVVANSKRYTLKWSVTVISDSNGQSMPRIDYRATYLKRNHRFTITGFPAGWDNQFIGTGSCKRTK